MRERIMVTRAMNPVRASPCHPSDDTPRHGSARRRTGWRSLGGPLGVEHQADLAADRASLHGQLCTQRGSGWGPDGGRAWCVRLDPYAHYGWWDQDCTMQV